MTTEQFEQLKQKAIKYTPSWLKEDISHIIEREGINVRASKVVATLYNTYASSLTEYFASLNQDFSWRPFARERLNIIDNNLDIIGYLVEEIKKQKKQEK